MLIFIFRQGKIRMRRLLVSALCLFTVSAFASSSASMPSGYAPAINKTNQHPLVKTEYVPVAMPGQMMPLQKRSTQKYPSQYSSRRLTGLSAVKAANLKAKRMPMSSRFINAIMTYDYMPGALFQIYCEPLNVTDLQFQGGEHIISVAAGDTLRWQVSRTFSGSGLKLYEHLLIKPIDSGLTNSLVVTTDQRTYHLQLHSTAGAYMASVNWQYPQSDGFVKMYSQGGTLNSTSFSGNGLSLNKLDFDYKANLLSGKAPSWMPWMVFNDGSKTYVQFPPHMQIAPTLFVGTDPVQARIVNYRVEGNYYIIDQVIESLILRIGQMDPTVVQIVHGK